MAKKRSPSKNRRSGRNSITLPRRRRSSQGHRLSGIESLESRIVLDGSGFPGNECPPDLDLSGVAAQTVVAGEPLIFDLYSAGATVEDLDGAGTPTGNVIRLLLDPDVPADTPVGASITEGGLFSWTPSLVQIGTYEIVVIAVDQGTPPLADAETFTVEVTDPNLGNQAPVVDLNGPEPGDGFASTFIEDAGPVPIVDIDLSVDDIDNTTLASALVVLTDRPDGNAESLSVVTAGTSISAVYNPATGELSLSGEDTLANYQQVLRTLEYNNTSDSPDTADRVVNVTANDGTDDSATVTATITVEAENDPANVDLNGGDDGADFAVTFTEDGGPVTVVDTDATIEDVDNATLASATISITNLLDGTAEELTVLTVGTSIVVDDSIAGTLLLTGADTVANYQHVLRTLRYNNTSQNPDTTDRSITITVNDGTDDSVARTSVVSIVPMNDAPDLAPILDQNAMVGQLLEVIVTATDPEDDGLTFQFDPQAVGIPALATITPIDNNSATISWTPAIGDGVGPFTFVILVTDDDPTDPLSDTETFTVTLVSDPPVVDLNGDGTGIDFAATFTEDDGAVPIVDTDLAVTHPSAVNLSSATVTITNLLDGDAEVLSVDDSLGPNITASYDSATGVLTLTGSDTPANYQAVLRTLDYDNTSQDPTTDDREIEVVVNDGVNDSVEATTIVSVVAENDSPNLILPSPFDDGMVPVETEVDQLVTFTATVVDPDHASDEVFFILDLDNSGIPDGAALPSISTPPVDVPGGVFIWTPDTVGTFEIIVLTIDADGLADSETFTVNVTDVLPISGSAAVDSQLRGKESAGGFDMRLPLAVVRPEDPAFGLSPDVLQEDMSIVAEELTTHSNTEILGSVPQIVYERLSAREEFGFERFHAKAANGEQETDAKAADTLFADAELMERLLRKSI